jgi:hypothetical protein
MARGAAVAVAAAACCAALAATAGGQTATTGTPQALFTHQIETDRATASDVRGALRAHRAFVDADIAFADITGDQRQDAVVRVDSAGAAGTIAVYVFSADAATKLRAVYRNQHVYRAMIAVSGTTLLVSTPRWSAGDELCCPASLLERTLTWSARAKRLVVRSTRTVPVTGSAAPQTSG